MFFLQILCLISCYNFYMKKFFGYFILILIAISMLYPFFAMVYLSFQGDNAIFTSEFTTPSLANYKAVIHSIPVERYFFNSLIVAVITTIGQLIIASLAGYAFAKLKFKGRDFLFLIILITMLVPPQVNIVPLFFLMREMHLVDTYQALILPGLFGGLGVFMMRQHFLNFPKDLEESARIDGCNLFHAFFKIAFPLALPAL